MTNILISITNSSNHHQLPSNDYYYQHQQSHRITQKKFEDLLRDLKSSTEPTAPVTSILTSSNQIKHPSSSSSSSSSVTVTDPSNHHQSHSVSPDPSNSPTITKSNGLSDRLDWASLVEAAGELDAEDEGLPDLTDWALEDLVRQEAIVNRASKNQSEHDGSQIKGNDSRTDQQGNLMPSDSGKISEPSQNPELVPSLSPSSSSSSSDLTESSSSTSVSSLTSPSVLNKSIIIAVSTLSPPLQEIGLKRKQNRFQLSNRQRQSINLLISGSTPNSRITDKRIDSSNKAPSTAQLDSQLEGKNQKVEDVKEEGGGDLLVPSPKSQVKSNDNTNKILKEEGVGGVVTDSNATGIVKSRHKSQQRQSQKLRKDAELGKSRTKGDRLSVIPKDGRIEEKKVERCDGPSNSRKRRDRNNRQRNRTEKEQDLRRVEKKSEQIPGPCKSISNSGGAALVPDKVRDRHPHDSRNQKLNCKEMETLRGDTKPVKLEVKKQVREGFRERKDNIDVSSNSKTEREIPVPVVKGLDQNCQKMSVCSRKGTPNGLNLFEKLTNGMLSR
ncbi:expressed protein [Phakopsora pachyrhizi]|uniref:Expressed protein n=1 Tax=Phakopsora pachyrhizi TaxID=170000 RepID=A0AAV0B9H8_PHAPC|nr:expressed protein [Phakopsora pachyrhizi]